MICIVGVKNVVVGASRQEQTRLSTYTLANVTCAGCGTQIGLTYVDASAPGHKFKIGYFLLQPNLIARKSKLGSSHLSVTSSTSHLESGFGGILVRTLPLPSPPHSFSWHLSLFYFNHIRQGFVFVW